MATTLRERQQLRRDAAVLREHLQIRRVQLLLEKIDEEDFQKVSNIAGKLHDLKGRGSQVLDKAIDDALTDLNKITGGDPSSWTQKHLPTFLKAINKGENAKIFKNAMGLVSAIETGMRLIPQMLKNMLGNIKSGSPEASKTVQDLVLMGEGVLREADPAFSAARPGDEPAQAAELEKSRKKWGGEGGTGPGKQKWDQLIKNISKAMKPSKWWGLGTGEIPYADADALVSDMLSNIPVGELMGLATTVTSGPQASNLGKEIAGPEAGGETTGTETSAQTGGTTGTKPGAETKTAGEPIPTGTGEPARRAGGEEYTAAGEYKGDVPDDVIDRWADEVGSTLSDVTPQQFKKVLQVLNHAGKLKEAIRRGHVVRIIRNVQARLQDLEAR